MSGVSFPHIPRNLRVPLFYAELDASQANLGTQALNALLIGQMLPAGTAPPNRPILVTDPQSAIAWFGRGSMLARMVASYRRQDAGSCNLWCLPLQDDAASSVATATVTVTGTASAAGTIALYIAGQRLNIGVHAGDTGATVAANVVTAVNADADLPVTAIVGVPAAPPLPPPPPAPPPPPPPDTPPGGGAPAPAPGPVANGPGGCAPSIGPLFKGSMAGPLSPAFPAIVAADSTGGVLTLLCKWGGATGNDVTLLDSFLGWAAGEKLPAGLAITYSGPTLAGGSADPSLAATAIPAMGDEPYDFVIHPYAQAQALDDLALEFNDATGRWSYARQLYGHGYTARRGILTDLAAFGLTRNDQHHTVAAIDAGCPSPCWEYAAAYGGANAVDIAADPARPTQTTPMVGMLAPRAGERFLFEDRQTLLNFGIATSYVAGGQLCVERAITTYQVNAFGTPDTSYLDSETLHTSAYVLRTLKAAIATKYPRHKLADDGTRFAAGQAIVTPSVIRGELCAIYGQLVYQGIVENLDTFKRYLIVERDADDPNRVNVLFPPDYTNQLRVFALLNQFRLQYPADQVVA